MKIQWQLISVNRKRRNESRMGRRENTRVGNPRRKRKHGKRRRGGGKTREIERGERESRRRVLPARRVGVDRQRGRGGNLGFLGDGKKWNERIESRLVRVMVDVKEDDLDMMTMRGRIDNVPDPVMRTEIDIFLDLAMRIGMIDIAPDPLMRTEIIDIAPDPVMRTEMIDIAPDPVMRTGRIGTILDPTMSEVNDTAQSTVTTEKSVNLPDRDSIEKKKDEDHITIAIHPLDQIRVNLLGMVIPNPDLGRGRGMIGIDVQ